MRANIAAILLISLAGCHFYWGSDDTSIGEDDPTPPPTNCTANACYEQVGRLPSSINRNLDLLFVLDNSGSMAEEQASLTANFHRLTEVLEAVPGGLPNLHIGIVTTDLGAGAYNITGCSGRGDDGVLQNSPGATTDCGVPDDRYIIDIAEESGGRLRNYDGALDDTFSCIASLGVTGCGFEQPLEAMRRALDGGTTENAGFLRADANLAVVFISDEDDCSTENTQMFDTSTSSVSSPLGPLSSFRCFEFGVVCDDDSPRTPGTKTNCVPRDDSQYMYPVDGYIEFLRSLKSDSSQLFVAAVVGNDSPVAVGANTDGEPTLNPSCVSATGEASPAVRLTSFAKAFPNQHVTTTICNDDLSPAMVMIGERVGTNLGSPCLAGDIYDTEAAPGLQFDCRVADVRNTEETAIPVCNNPGIPDQSSNFPCYLIVEDEICTGTRNNLAVRVYPESRQVQPGTTTVVTCLTNN